MSRKPAARFLSYLNWLLNPIHGLSTTQVYDLIGTASLTEHELFLNLGYWRTAGTMDEASRALARLVAQAGAMTEADTVVDCGFGFGDQDMLWANEFRPERIIGFNITASHVERARQRVADAGLSHCIDLREGSATEMDLPDRSADLVVALESAFHFHTREAFFREAFRVLRPGGRLVTADILPTAPAAEVATRLRQRLSWYLVASRFNIPRANVYLTQTYADKLRAAGFEAVTIESIRDDIYEPMHEFIAANPALLDRQHPVARLLAKATLHRTPANVYAGLDYILAVATRPPSRGP